MPRLLLEPAQDIVVLGVKLDLVLVEVVEEVIGTKDLCDLDKLIRVAAAVEERLLSEDHRGKHGTQAPHVQAVIVFLEVDKQFRPFEVAGGNTNVVLGPGVVELSETPVDQTQLDFVRIFSWLGVKSLIDSAAYLAVLMVDHNVVRLDVAVHDSLAVAEIESLE